MATIREYQRVQGTTLTKIRVLTDQTGAYAVLVTTRRPNPEYRVIHWLDKRDISSHLYKSHAVHCADEQSALTAYQMAVELDRVESEGSRNHATSTTR